MGLFDSFKSKKKKKSEETAGNEALELLPLDDAGIDPPETRYTQEYQEFLASQEAAERGGMPAEEGYPAVSPEGFCARFDRCVTSLIEEPEACEVCAYYCDGDGTCRWPEKAQEALGED